VTNKEIGLCQDVDPSSYGLTASRVVVTEYLTSIQILCHDTMYVT